MPSPTKPSDARAHSPVKTSLTPPKVAEDQSVHQSTVDPKLALMTLQSEEQMNFGNQVALMNARLQAELEEQRQRVNAQFDHELNVAQASIEQARAQALFFLEQQISQRKAELERRLQHELRMMEIKAAKATFSSGSFPLGVQPGSMMHPYLCGSMQPQVYGAIPQGSIQYAQQHFFNPMGLPTLYPHSLPAQAFEATLSPRGFLAPSQQMGTPSLNRPVI